MAVDADGTVRLLTAFQLADGRVVAIVRGLGPADGDGPAPPSGAVTQTGIFLPTEAAADHAVPPGTYASVRLPQIVQEWPQRLVPGFVTLDRDQAQAQGLYPATAILPTGEGSLQNLGYALQWWVFAAFALLYGIVETTNGNWATLYMTGTLGASTTLASVALTTFWAMVTVGRLLFAAIERVLPEPRVYRVLPFVAAAALLLLAVLPSGSTTAGVLGFALAGLGCSALLPLTISFGQRELVAVGASLAGLLIAVYQMGYGVAAFGIGPLQERVGMGFSTILIAVAVVAVVMGVLAAVVVRERPAIPASSGSAARPRRRRPDHVHPSSQSTQSRESTRCR